MNHRHQMYQKVTVREQDYVETLSGFQEQMSESPNVLDMYLTLQGAACSLNRFFSLKIIPLRGLFAKKRSTIAREKRLRNQCVFRVCESASSFSLCTFFFGY